MRAEPREGESGLGSPILRQEPGRDGRKTAVFRYFPVPYRAGIGGRCWSGRPLASCLGERGVAGGGFARGTELFTVGRYWQPRWRKNLFAIRGEVTTSQGRSCRVCMRVDLYPSICVSVRIFPRERWDGSGWKRVAGRSCRATPEGREGRGRPCAAQTSMGGRLSRAAPQPRRSPGRPGACKGPAAPGYPPR